MNSARVVRVDGGRCVTCNEYVVDAWICQMCAFNSYETNQDRLDDEPMRRIMNMKPTTASKRTNKRIDQATGYDHMRAAQSLILWKLFDNIEVRGAGGKVLVDSAYAYTLRIARLLATYYLPGINADERARILAFKIPGEFRHPSPEQRKRRRQIMTQSRNDRVEAQRVYQRKYLISSHALERYRERVDHEHIGSPDWFLGDLLDRRLKDTASSDWEPINDKRALGAKSFIVRCLTSRDDAKYYAVIRDNTVVTILSDEMALKNFAEGSWTRIPLNSPFTKAALAGVTPVPSRDVKVNIPVIVDLPVAPNPAPAVEAAQNVERIAAEIKIAEGDRDSKLVELAKLLDSTEPQSIEHLASALGIAGHVAKNARDAFDYAKTHLEQSMALLRTAQERLNDAVADISGVGKRVKREPVIAVEEDEPVDLPTREDGERRERRFYTDDEKARFVELVKNGDTVRQVAMKWNLTASALMSWCKKAGVKK